MDHFEPSSPVHFQILHYSQQHLDCLSDLAQKVVEGRLTIELEFVHTITTILYVSLQLYIQYQLPSTSFSDKIYMMLTSFSSCSLFKLPNI